MSIRASTFGLAVAALALTPAGAADLGRPITKAPPAPVVPPFTWTGCYVGGFVGGAFRDGDPTFTDLGNGTFRAFSGGVTTPVTVAAPHSFSTSSSDGSFLGGGTLGCNWQPVGSAFVLGIEGEGGYLHFRDSAFDPLLAPGVPVTSVGLRGAPGVAGVPDVLGTARTGDWYAMITGRLGYAAWDRWMIYAKGGAAFVHNRATVTDVCATIAAGCGNWLIATGFSDTTTTWTAGGGVEWAFAPSWSVKVEYMFIGDPDSKVSCATATFATGAAVPGGPFCFNHDFGGIHTVKVGLNWRFSSFGFGL